LGRFEEAAVTSVYVLGFTNFPLVSA